LLLTGLIAAGLHAPVQDASAAEGAPSVVVTTTMLECAAREVTQGQQGIRIVRLLPPGACPGHFDLSPRALPSLRAAVAVIRHDFQQVLDEKLAQLGASRISTVAVSTPGSFLVPANYLQLLRQTAVVLAESFPERRAAFLQSVEAARARLTDLADRLRECAPTWQGAPIIVSQHQKQFSEWLGLKPLAVLPRPEDMAPRDLRQLLDTPAAMIVSNLQSDQRAALSLGRRTGLPVAVFSSFPNAPGYGTGYDQLLEQNVRRLAQAWSDGPARAK